MINYEEKAKHMLDQTHFRMVQNPARLKAATDFLRAFANEIREETASMKKCQVCKRDFPDDLIQDLAQVKDGKLTYTEMCPICALDEMRAMPGNADYMFGGKIAKSLYDRAVAHVERKTT